jgi:hypothetical protein
MAVSEVNGIPVPEEPDWEALVMREKNVYPVDSSPEFPTAEELGQVRAFGVPEAEMVHTQEVRSPVSLGFLVSPQPVQLTSHTAEHYTPSDIVERARGLMGSIDLDPASCIDAQKVVRANYFITQERLPVDAFGGGELANLLKTGIQGDGLSIRPWRGNVFLNPPGGTFKILNKKFSNAALWWSALVQDWLAGEVKQAIFIGFTLEILRHSQNGCPLPVQWFPRCYPKKRIKFLGRVKQSQPTHGNVIVWLPPIDLLMRMGDTSRMYRDGVPNYEKFIQAFGALGLCEHFDT